MNHSHCWLLHHHTNRQWDETLRVMASPSQPEVIIQWEPAFVCDDRDHNPVTANSMPIAENNQKVWFIL